MLEIGQYVGSYRILRKLGEGGMGAVYEAVHDQIARRVAIKILLPQFASDRGVAQRFLNEARAVNLIGHPGLVEIYDMGQCPDGAAFIVMEMLPGETLTARLERRGGRLELAETLNILRQLTAALLAAHEKNIVHRDLKPDNVMLVRDSSQPSGERVKLLDFGIAKLTQAGEPSGATAAKLTRTGSVMGTALYMAPEQCTGAGWIDAKADVYALGAVLFHMLAGRPPFTGEGLGAIMAQHIYAEPPSLAVAGNSVPAELTDLVARMLAKEPAQRPSAEEILSATQDLAECFPFVRSALRSGEDGALPLIKTKSERGTLSLATAQPRTNKRRSKGGKGTMFLLGVLVAAIGFGGIYYRASPSGAHSAPSPSADLGLEGSRPRPASAPRTEGTQMRPLDPITAPEPAAPAMPKAATQGARAVQRPDARSSSPGIMLKHKRKAPVVQRSVKADKDLELEDTPSF